MGNTGVVRAYNSQFDAKLNAYMQQRIDFFAFQVAKHIFYSRPTHAQIDSSVVNDTVQLEFRADSDLDRGRIKRVEINHVGYGSIAERMRNPRLETARMKVMEYGIPFDPGRACGDTIYLDPMQMAVEDIDKALLARIFTGSVIMPAVGAPIPDVLNKTKLSKLDLIAVAYTCGYKTPDTALEKIRYFFSRPLNNDGDD